MSGHETLRVSDHGEKTFCLVMHQSKYQEIWSRPTFLQKQFRTLNKIYCIWRFKIQFLCFGRLKVKFYYALAFIRLVVHEKVQIVAPLDRQSRLSHAISFQKFKIQSKFLAVFFFLFSVKSRNFRVFVSPFSESFVETNKKTILLPFVALVLLP